MLGPRPFRFGAAPYATASAAAYFDTARRIEALGYATLQTADHFNLRWFEPGPALMAAALATSTLRVSCTVFDNDFRHPALLAKEAASVDVLSGGRLEFGIGAGWLTREYDQTGIPFEPPAVRVSRLEEAVQVIKGLWGDDPLTFSGRHYTITGLAGTPRPVQRPHPPIFIGGGGKRLLSLAGREADIVGINMQATPDGRVTGAGSDDATVAQRVEWVHQAAGERFGQLELALLVFNAVLTDTRAAQAAAAEELAATLEITPEQVLSSPYYMIGSVEQMVDDLLELRQRHGISYISVVGRDVETFAPVVARLTGS
jgi:probable F420-dependent oxidoreductase